jgi:hypothetical protein
MPSGRDAVRPGEAVWRERLHHGWPIRRVFGGPVALVHLQHLIDGHRPPRHSGWSGRRARGFTGAVATTKSQSRMMRNPLSDCSGSPHEWMIPWDPVHPGGPSARCPGAASEAESHPSTCWRARDPDLTIDHERTELVLLQDRPRLTAGPGRNQAPPAPGDDCGAAARGPLEAGCSAPARRHDGEAVPLPPVQWSQTDRPPGGGERLGAVRPAEPGGA